MSDEEVERAVSFLLESQARLGGQIAETNRIIRLHAESQLQLNETLTTAITALADSQRMTDERLTGIVGLVEKLAERVGGA